MRRPAALLAAVVDEDLGANPLTLAEVLVVPARNGRADAVLAVLRDLEAAERHGVPVVQRSN